MVNEVSRTLRGYEKDGDELVIEIELPPLDIAYLQDLFGMPRDNPMFDAYEVGSKQKAELQKHIQKEIDLDKYEFFLE